MFCNDFLTRPAVEVGLCFKSCEGTEKELLCVHVHPSKRTSVDVMEVLW